MELQLIKPKNNHSTVSDDFLSSINEILIAEEITESNLLSDKQKHFIEANTEEVTLDYLKTKCTIPVFSKDNETTIPHQQFIEIISDTAQQFYTNQKIDNPDIRVSHVVKGRIPQAIGKPAKDLLEHEKTVYYERMAFVITIPTITENVNGNQLSLTIGGVRAYNNENLYSKKTIEKFKVFIGFQNSICTNLCISTDGFAQEIRVSNTQELQVKILELLQQYNINKHVQQMQDYGNYELTEQQFAQLIGKTRLYHYLPMQQKRELPFFDLNDGQVNAVAKDYYHDDSFSRNANGNINLWKLYNLFTGATKSSYIDNFLNRTVNAHTFTTGISKALQGDERYSWFLE
jgi:hypothetical protein